jgi:hypothetical protein
VTDVTMAETRSRRASLLKGAAIVLLVLLVIPFVYVYFAAPADPVYNGVRLSEHLERLYGAKSPFRGPFSAARLAEVRAERERHSRLIRESHAAMRQAGPEATPLLCDWLRAETPPWRRIDTWVRKKLGMLPPVLFDRGAAACMAINHFELVDRRFIPLLRARLNSGHSASLDDTARALARNVEAAGFSVQEREEFARDLIASLAAAPPRPDRWMRADIIERSLNLCSVEPAVRNLLLLEAGGPGDRVGAAMFFVDSPTRAERVIPALLANLNSTNATLVEYSVKALKAYGPHARPALPVLSNLVAHPRKHVASAASEAIRAIQSAGQR